jgi:hypothetical protein
MNCRDFDQYWATRLDARTVVAASDDAMRHADACQRCGRLARGYERLDRAVASLSAVHPVDPHLSARILTAYQDQISAPLEKWDSYEPAVPFRSRRLMRVRWIAAAAAVLMGVFAIGRFAGINRSAPELASNPAPPVIAPRPIGEVFSDATAATASLARETSEPAARLGRDVLASAAAAVPVTSTEIPSKPSSDRSASPIFDFRRIGDGVQSGLSPISRPARHAFGFLVPGTKVDAQSEGRKGTGA